MPYIKSKPVHTTVDKTLRYILNPDKTAELRYADSLNCFTDAHLAYMNMKAVYEHYSGRSFTEPKPENGNCPIKAIHLIQSFSAEDGVSPEEVHRIGMELVKKMYGDKVQAVVTTHVDKEHIHNHIALCSYTIDGKKLYNTISEVERARDISDLLCKLYGVRNVMQTKARRKGQRMTYCEWMHRKQGTSWKAKISDYILTLLPVADDLEHMLKIMEAHGYTVNRGKYISVLAPGQQRAIRLRSLGEGFDEKSLEEHIANLVASRPKYLSPREIIEQVTSQVMYETCNIGFADSVVDNIRRLSKHLAIINSEHICSVGEAESRLHETENEIAKLAAKITDLEADIQRKQLIFEAASRYFGKHRLGEYSSEQKKQDKQLLQNNSITSLMGVAGYQSDIDVYNAELAEVRARLTELTDKTEIYRGIIETCTRDRDDILSKIRKEVDRRLTEQERDRIEAMKADRFRIYRPTADYDDTFEDGGPAPNVDDCELLVDGNMFEVKEKGSESEALTDRLEATYRYYNLRIGDLIAIGDLAYRVNKQGYSVLKTFTKSRAEKERERQEELAREEQERTEAEERQREEEQKKKKEEETTKQVQHKTRNKLHL